MVAWKYQRPIPPFFRSFRDFIRLYGHVMHSAQGKIYEPLRRSIYSRAVSYRPTTSHRIACPMGCVRSSPMMSTPPPPAASMLLVHPPPPKSNDQRSGQCRPKVETTTVSSSFQHSWLRTRICFIASYFKSGEPMTSVSPSHWKIKGCLDPVDAGSRRRCYG